MYKLNLHLHWGPNTPQCPPLPLSWVLLGLTLLCLTFKASYYWASTYFTTSPSAGALMCLHSYRPELHPLISLPFAWLSPGIPGPSVLSSHTTASGRCSLSLRRKLNVVYRPLPTPIPLSLSRDSSPHLETLLSYSNLSVLFNIYCLIFFHLGA